MRLHTALWVWLVATQCHISPAAAGPLVRRDADFASVRTPLEKSYNNVDPKNPDKYFHEARFHEHYDGRFGDRPLPEASRGHHLRALVQTYFLFMSSIGVETWLMHGSLLGWYWNRQIMPWDSDLDVMLSRRSLEHLAQGYNMTIHRYLLPRSDLDDDEAANDAGDVFREYLLEINPHYTHDHLSRHNRIDARWIDTNSGLFIDITALRPNVTAQEQGVDGAMMAKDGHHYLYDDIYPLRRDEFEGVTVLVPYAYGDILTEEYGNKALATTSFSGHYFDQSLQQWVVGRQKSSSRFRQFMSQHNLPLPNFQ